VTTEPSIVTAGLSTMTDHPPTLYSTCVANTRAAAAKAFEGATRTSYATLREPSALRLSGALVWMLNSIRSDSARRSIRTD
jgi:hypothetical protein